MENTVRLSNIELFHVVVGLVVVTLAAGTLTQKGQHL